MGRNNDTSVERTLANMARGEGSYNHWPASRMSKVMHTKLVAMRDSAWDRFYYGCERGYGGNFLRPLMHEWLELDLAVEKVANLRETLLRSPMPDESMVLGELTEIITKLPEPHRMALAS